VKKAVKLFKRGLIFSQNSNFDENNAKYINDAAYFPKKIIKYAYIKSDLLRNLMLDSSKFLSLFNIVPVFGLYDNIILLWDLVNFICILFLLFWIPFEIGFMVYLPEFWYKIFFGIFLGDVFVNMNSAFIENGYIVKDRWRIYSRYFRNYLIYDIMSFICFIISRPNKEASRSIHSDEYLFVLQCLFFLRIRNLLNIYQKFLERIYSLFNIRDSYIDLLNLIFINIFLIHLFACFWHFLPYRNGSPDDMNWMKKIGIDEDPWPVQYEYSLYWSAVTIMTVGYGDITAQNSQEMIFTMVAVCFGCGVVAFIISSIGRIFNEFSKDSQVYK